MNANTREHHWKRSVYLQSSQSISITFTFMLSSLFFWICKWSFPSRGFPIKILHTHCLSPASHVPNPLKPTWFLYSGNTGLPVQITNKTWTGGTQENRDKTCQDCRCSDLDSNRGFLKLNLESLSFEHTCTVSNIHWPRYKTERKAVPNLYACYF